MSHTLKRLLGLALTLLLCLTMIPVMAESCAHPEPYLEYSTTVKSDVPPAPADVSYHSTTGDLYETVYCHYCCETVSETLLESNHTAMDNHCLTGGICDSCGYETICEHPAEMVEVSTFIQYSDYPVKVDDYQHSGTGTRFADYYCAECMCRFDCNTILEENTTVFEDHYFFTEDGTCAYCGCENPCTHASTYSYNEYADPAGYPPWMRCTTPIPAKAM